MKRLLLGLALGFFTGSLEMAYLAQRASRVFFAEAMDRYGFEEHIAAACAHREGAMDDAALHYANVAAMKSTEGWAARTEMRHGWSIGFPITAAFVWHWKLFGAFPLEGEPATQARIEGMFRALRADALEKAGRHGESEVEYVRAAALVGGMAKAHVVLHSRVGERLYLPSCDAPVPRVEALAAGQSRQDRQ